MGTLCRNCRQSLTVYGLNICNGDSAVGQNNAAGVHIIRDEPIYPSWSGDHLGPYLRVRGNLDEFLMKSALELANQKQ